MLKDAKRAGDAIDDLLCQAPKTPPAPTPPPPPPPGLCRIAVNPATAQGAGPAMSGFGGGNASLVWDGDTQTFYDFSNPDGGWSQTEIGAATVSYLEFFPRPGAVYLDR